MEPHRRSAAGSGRRLAAAVALGALVLASACGRSDQSAGRNEAFSDGAPSSHGSAPGRPSASSPTGTGGGLALPTGTAAALTAAADKTTNQRSARFTMSINQVTPTGEVPQSTGSGEYDSSRSHVTMTLAPGTGGVASLGGGPIELITDGDTIYIKSPVLGGVLGGGDVPWISFSQTDPAQTGFGAQLGSVVPFGGTINPQSFLDSLKDAGDVTSVGEENLDGVHTTHYRATIDSTATTRPGVSSFGGQTYTEDVWIDDDGIVRRISYIIDAGKAGGAAGVGGLSGKLHVTFDLMDVGQPVDIQIPPPDQVTQAGDLSGLGGIGGAGGLPSIPGSGADDDPFGGN